jgi:hypothetical protein
LDKFFVLERATMGRGSRRWHLLITIFVPLEEVIVLVPDLVLAELLIWCREDSRRTGEAANDARATGCRAAF